MTAYRRDVCTAVVWGSRWTVVADRSGRPGRRRRRSWWILGINPRGPPCAAALAVCRSAGFLQRDSPGTCHPVLDIEVLVFLRKLLSGLIAAIATLAFFLHVVGHGVWFWYSHRASVLDFQILACQELFGYTSSQYCVVEYTGPAVRPSRWGLSTVIMLSNQGWPGPISTGKGCFQKPDTPC